MIKKKLGSLFLSAVLTVSVLCAAEGPAAAQDGADQQAVLPADVQSLMEEEGHTALSDDLADSLNSIVFENPDGSRSLYMYDQPVKYRDETGKVRFKTNKAKKTDKKNQAGKAVYSFENEDNDVKAYLPERIDSGILMETENYRLEVFPETEKNSKVKRTGAEEEPLMEYRKALGEDTHLQYAYTGLGLKENIVLDRYTGRHTFQFRVDTHGLVPQENEGNVIVLQDPETGEAVFTFDQMDVRDADFAQTRHYEDVSYENYYRISPAPDAGESSSTYILTAVIDREFLEAETTSYPVTIDPTTRYVYNIVGDTSVFRGKTGNYSAAGMHYVGYNPNDGVEAYTLVQFDTTAVKYINVNKISKAYYKPLVTGAAAGWNVVLAVPQDYWTPSTVKFSDVNNNYRTLSTTYMSNASEALYSFDITAEFIKWLKADLGETSDYDSRRGIMLMPGSNCPANSYRGFYSAESAASNRPALVVEYTPDTSLAPGTYFIKNFACDRYLDVYYAETSSGTGTNICNFNGNDNQRWNVERVSSSSEFYFIRPAHAPSMYLYADDAYGCRLTISTSRMVWKIVGNSDGSYRLMPDQTERQAAESASGSTADGTVVQTWGYGGAPNQKWVFQAATTWGGAGGYRVNNSSKVNCFGYALELDYTPSLYMAYGDSVQTVYNRVAAEVNKLGRGCRKLSSKDAYIRPTEYKIAMRVGSHKINGVERLDYHFMVQVNRSDWAHKRGGSPSAFLGAINPSTIDWGELYGYSGFYDSATIYFAVTR